jgi:hypothetical protein
VLELEKRKTALAGREKFKIQIQVYMQRVPPRVRGNAEQRLQRRYVVLLLFHPMATVYKSRLYEGYVQFLFR